MAAITEAQEKVIRSYVGQVETIAEIQDVYDRLLNFDDLVLETLRKQLAVMVSDDTALIVIDGQTLNKTENIRQLRTTIKAFKNEGGTGLETGADAVLGPTVSQISRPELR